MTGDLAVDVPAALRRSQYVVGVELEGSRARGTAGRFSDWDFVVATDEFERVAGELSDLVEPLEPLVRQWDRLSERECYMLIVEGPAKIDLIFADVPHQDEPPWNVDATTLPGVDDHFWDWSLWLLAKLDAGKRQLVTAELAKMHVHMLGPLGLPEPPPSLRAAVESYLALREGWENRLGVAVDRRTADHVAPLLLAATAP